jgi:hypothetical protein
MFTKKERLVCKEKKMTDLFFYDIPNTVKARAQKIKVDELLVKDPESGSYIPIAPNPGVEVPYYAKPAMVDFTVDSLRATMDQTGVDVIDKRGTQPQSSPRQLSPWVTLGVTPLSAKLESRQPTT